MKIKIPSNNISRKYYHLSNYDISDVDNINLFIDSGEVDTLPFKVGQIKYFKRGTMFKAAVYRRTPETFEYFIFGKQESSPLTTIQTESYIGIVNDLIEMLYKHNFTDCTKMDFIQHFRKMVSNLYLSNHFTQEMISFNALIKQGLEELK